MALRVMQIFVPQSTANTLDQLLEGRDILGRWHDTHKDQTILHLLVPAEETEPIMDQFEQNYAAVDGFHVVLFPVEAVLPRAKIEERPPETQEQPAEQDPQRVSREELYAEVSESIGISRVFLGLTILSAVVAAVGLMRDDVPVIIGAMVIAPLLGPNVAMSLAITLGDMKLLRRAFNTNLVGVASAFLFAVLIGAIFRVNPETPAIAARTSVAFGDILLALAAGAAGTLAFTRGLSGAVIGVMVAVALVPPLVVAGVLLGNGQATLACGALLLTAANVICINLAGIVTFFVQGVRPRTWWEAERAKSSARKAIVIWTFLLALLLFILWLDAMGWRL